MKLVIAVIVCLMIAWMFHDTIMFNTYRLDERMDVIEQHMSEIRPVIDAEVKKSKKYSEEQNEISWQYTDQLRNDLMESAFKGRR